MFRTSQRPSLITPSGMSRRHFMKHLAAVSAMTAPAMSFTHSLQANAAQLRKRNKAAILLWMGGGPSTIDLWDLKPGAETGGPFQPISTTGDVQICEHLPLVAQQMHNLSVVRSMSTREADHDRGRYYMHTGFVPNPNMTHPSYGSVISHELSHQTRDLEIPPFVSIGGGSEGPGFLGMSWAPFVVDTSGRVRNLDVSIPEDRLKQRMYMLNALEKNFIKQQPGRAAEEHQKVLDKTFSLMTSQQMGAFKYQDEPESVRERYGDHGFGRGCLMARRLIESGVTFVEVDFGGWDNHQDIFSTLTGSRLPQLDQGMSALVADLEERGLLDDTVVMWMGEFGRTPRINANVGRDHYARAWSCVVGGGGLKSGITVGETDDLGLRVTSTPYTSEDLMATVCQALGISLQTTFTSRDGRPMKIANGGKLIRELIS